jgi:hypothetical protein
MGKMPSNGGTEVELRLRGSLLQVISQDFARFFLHGPAVAHGPRSESSD